jgi:Uma2 family endonuclease
LQEPCLELWEGEFVEMSPIEKKHAGCVDEISEILKDYLNKQAIVRTQNPIILNDFGEPQPDVCLLKRRDDFYRLIFGDGARRFVDDGSCRYDRKI